MKRTMLLVAVLALAGCATNTQVNGGGGSVGVQANTNRGALLAILFLAIASSGETGEPQAGYRGNAFPTFEPVPPMDPARKVSEQDCTKPIEDWSANLRCR